MNPRQRRGLLLIGVSIVGALAVFLSVSNFVADVQSQVGPLGPELRLVEAVEPFEPIAADALEIVQVPLRWRPPDAIGSAADIAGRVASTLLPPGTVLQHGMLIEPPSVEPGTRQLAILVDAETGVGGQIGVGDVVDVIATRAGDEENPPSAVIAIEAATILSIGTPQAAQEQSPTGAFAENEVVPVTFALAPDDVLRLAWVESFAVSVRLALRSPLDDGLLADPQRLFQPESADLSGAAG